MRNNPLGDLDFEGCVGRALVEAYQRRLLEEGLPNLDDHTEVWVTAVAGASRESAEEVADRLLAALGPVDWRARHAVIGAVVSMLIQVKFQLEAQRKRAAHPERPSGAN